jgi:Bacterial surface protein, Ig-like domain
MKKRYGFILIAVIALFTSCEKDSIVSNDKQVGISRVTYYPNFEMAGDAVISIIKGSSFNDPGVKATAGGADVPVITTGSVDVSTVGLYVLTYSATNADGYSGSVTRTVVVIPTAETPGVDLSGTYVAVPVGTTPGPAQISKVAEGVYYSTDIWTGGAVIPGYFICLDGNSVSVPLQNTGYGRMLTQTDGTYVNGLITWVVTLLDQGPFTATKKWQKQ